MVWMIIGMLAVIAVTTGWFSRIRLTVRFHKDTESRLEYTVSALFGLIQRRVTVPVMEWAGQGMVYEKKESGEDQTRMVTARDLNHMKDQIRTFKAELRRRNETIKGWLAPIRVEQLSTSSVLGMAEADYTAYAAALYRAGLSYFSAIIAAYLPDSRPRHDVRQLYGVNVFHCQATCILTIRMGHLIRMSMRLKRILTILRSDTNGTSD